MNMHHTEGDDGDGGHAVVAHVWYVLCQPTPFCVSSLHHPTRSALFRVRSNIDLFVRALHDRRMYRTVLSAAGVHCT
jgi:hypothetical protein